MFHRILETFFFIKVAAEYLVDSAYELGEEAYEEAKSILGKKRRQSQRKAAEQRKANDHRNGSLPSNGSGRTHTVKDLPPKFALLARQFSRYVMISFLSVLLGKS